MLLYINVSTTRRELGEELGVDFGGEDAVELGEGVEVGGDEGVKPVLEEVAEDLEGGFAVLSCEREVVHLELGAHVHPVVEVAKLVRHIEVTLGVCHDGRDARHSQFEDDVLEVAAPVHVRHLDKDRTVGIGEELIGVVRDAALEVLDDHVFGGESRRKLKMENGQLTIDFLLEVGIDFAEVGFGLRGIDVGVHVRGEDNLTDSVLNHGLNGTDGVFSVAETVVHTGKEVVVDVSGSEGDMSLGVEEVEHELMKILSVLAFLYNCL